MIQAGRYQHTNNLLLNVDFFLFQRHLVKMAPRGAKKRSQTGGGKGNATFPPLQQSATKAWAGVADSEFDLRVICKGKTLQDR